MWYLLTHGKDILSQNRRYQFFLVKDFLTISDTRRFGSLKSKFFCFKKIRRRGGEGGKCSLQAERKVKYKSKAVI